MFEITRQTDARAINRFVNDPTVYPHLKGAHEGPFDLAAVVARPDHVVLCSEYGGVIFIKHGPGYYEAHTAVVAEARGRWTLRMGHAALRWMFTRTDATEIVTKCPHGNLPAMSGARAVGARHEWTTRPIWPSEAGLMPVDVFTVTLHEWVARRRAEFQESGERFHRWLEERGVAPAHEDDWTHDVYVGAAVEMVEAGQVIKAVGFYNRWAIMSDYRPIRIIGKDPMMLDIGTATLFFDREWKVAPCQQAA